MRNVKLPSGFVKVERSEEEKQRSFSVNDEFEKDIRRRITDAIADALIKASKRSRER